MINMDFDSILSNIYWDPSNKSSLGSVGTLYKAAKKLNPKITFKTTQNWLRGQNAYTLHGKIRKKFPRRKTLSRGCITECKWI